MMALLPLLGVITMEEALVGLSDPNVVLIATLFVIGEGLVRTGSRAKARRLYGAPRGEKRSAPHRTAHGRRGHHRFGDEFHRGGRHFHSRGAAHGTASRHSARDD